MKRFTILFVILLGAVTSALQAQVTITGTVTSAEDGGPMIGVSVVQSANIGTTTDLNGNYTISVPADATELTFSYIGYQTKDVSIDGQTRIDVAMQPELLAISEVVVTALGISRDKKALGYSVDEFSSDQLDDVPVLDATTALQGKIAGVSIASSSGAPGASTRVIVRGISSLTGSNQPLYVIDGIPVNNERANANSTDPSTTVNRTVDFGNAASDINPNDIASITLLKGAAATSLYGSRAANGAIIITTKSASKNSPLEIGLSTAITITEVGRLPYMQDRYGQGWSGHFDPIENGSWGPLLDGELRLWGNTVDNSRKYAPFSFQENSMRDFYEYGQAYENNVSLKGGDGLFGYYASYSNSKSDGIVPGDVDLYNRNSILFKANGGTDKTKINFAANFISKDVSSVATGQGDDAGGGKTLFQEIMQNPVNHYIPEYRDYEDKFNNLDNFYTPYAQNPYYIINENGNEFKQNRLLTNFGISRSLMEGLTIAAKGGLDTYSSFMKDFGAIAKINPGAPNSTANDVLGLTKEEARNVSQYDGDLTINYNTSLETGIGKIGVNALVGENLNYRYSKRVTTVSKGLVVPEYYNVANISGSAIVSTYIEERSLVGLYGVIDLDLNEYLYLQLNARNDWSSTLPKENNSFFYPGINLGFIFTEVLPKNNILSYGKLRTSYAVSGLDADPYQTELYYSRARIRAGGFGLIEYPVGGVPAFEMTGILANPELKPEITKEIEIGTDLRFLQGRIGLDFTYYTKKTTDLIMEANIAASSGYYWQTSNLGQITNQGIEAKLNLKPVQTRNISWDLSYIFNQSSTVLDKLDEELGVSEYVINDAYDAEFVAIPGKELGQFRVPDYKYSPNGSIIVGDNGLPLEGDKILMGSALPDYTMSLWNSLNIYGVQLSALAEFQKGGYMYSYTASITYWSGNNEQSITNDRHPWVIPNSVQEVEAEDGTVSYVENSTPVLNNWHEYYSSNTNKPIESERIIEKTHFRLREVTLSYPIPSLFKNTKVNGTIGVYGRNLLLWTVADNSYVDPESTTWDNDLEGLFGEFAAYPSVRSYGVKLNITIK